jgi:hypothetical protein
MLGNVKALIAILAIAATVFHLAKPIALRFMSGEDFSRRRLVWLVLTAVYFVSPSFWLYALVAAPMFVWANRKDSNSVGLYLMMLHVIPPVDVAIPLLGNNGLFDLNNYRLLAFCVLLPAAMRYRKNREEATTGRLGSMDILLLAFGALEVALYTPPDLPGHFVIPDSPTNVMRRAFLFFLDTYLLYFTVSRTCQSRRKLVDAVAAFCLACALMAAIAMFERVRNWLLYVDIASHWGNDPHFSFYLSRGGSVRAQVAAGHSIALGHLLAIAFGFWLYLSTHIRSARHRIGATLLLCGGLLATFSRGAWLGAASLYFTFNAVGPRAVSRLMKGGALAIAIAGLILISPMGDQILDMLPKSGQPADPYRYRLAERGWELVFAHPMFGDQLPYADMEDLRQGEGIIDLVNTYLGVALGYGLVGLFCFLSFILLGMAKVYARTRELARSDPDLALFGTSLVACIVCTLVMIESNSFNIGPEKIFYLLAGFSTAYSRLARSPQQRPAVSGARETLQD